MQILDLIRNQETYRADASQFVFDVAKAMVDRNIGAVPVLREGLLVGIFSERDLMRRVVVQGLDSQVTRVEQVMTMDPLTVRPDESPELCMQIMSQHGFRHLPVCQGATLVGLISLRDLMLHDMKEKDDEVRMMRAYIHSSPQF